MRYEIRTERLLLRPLWREDAEEMFRNWASDPLVTENVTWDVHPNADMTRALLGLWEEQYEKPETYRFGIVLTQTGELMGSIDVVKYDDGDPEIGYCLGSRFWGHGYMTEACSALIEFLRAQGFRRIVIRALAENVRSCRVIEKCGFCFVKEEIDQGDCPKHAGKIIRYFELV